MTQVPRVGIAAIVKGPDDELTALMGVRKSSHGADTWAFPGGHLEHSESFFACAERETFEETGLRVRSKKVVATTNDLIPADGGIKHYVTLFVLCELLDRRAKPEAREPDKCEEWTWVAWSNIRSCGTDEVSSGSKSQQMPLFLPIINLLKDYPRLEQTLQE